MTNPAIQLADRYAKGDRSISQTDIVIGLLKETNLDRRYTLYALTVLGKWIDELTKFGCFRSIPLRETYTRLAYLLDNNLHAYLSAADQHAAKSQWIAAHLLTPTAISRLDPATHAAYAAFSRAAISRAAIQKHTAPGTSAPVVQCVPALRSTL